MHKVTLTPATDIQATLAHATERLRYWLTLTEDALHDDTHNPDNTPTHSP
jgi:hypothetical protein